jgi:hypothetical protein
MAEHSGIRGFGSSKTKSTSVALTAHGSSVARSGGTLPSLTGQSTLLRRFAGGGGSASKGLGVQPATSIGRVPPSTSSSAKAKVHTTAGARTQSGSSREAEERSQRGPPLYPSQRKAFAAASRAKVRQTEQIALGSTGRATGQPKEMGKDTHTQGLSQGPSPAMSTLVEYNDEELAYDYTYLPLNLDYPGAFLRFTGPPPHTELRGLWSRRPLVFAGTLDPLPPYPPPSWLRMPPQQDFTLACAASRRARNTA